jgi:two-component sensor histidine kinase
MISNSLKHGFKEKYKGKIFFHLSSPNTGEYHLKIGDDNNNVNTLFMDNSTNLGFELVNIFVDQLDGTIKQQEGSAIFHIDFKSIDK